MRQQHVTIVSVLSIAALLGLLIVNKFFDTASEVGNRLAAAMNIEKGGSTEALAGGLRVLEGFKVELLYAVPKQTQGSWVSMTVDPKGRLIVSDQYGALYRVTPSAAGDKSKDTKVEPINVALGEAHGLLWAFDSLYVVVNRGKKYRSGLYRVRDTDGDDKLDEIKLLRALEGSGEHGPHAVVLSPDGKSLYLAIGNHTKLTKIDSSRVPRVWREDQLLPRMRDANGHAHGVLAPGGHVLRTDPEGKHWELICNGFRNEYDIAFNADGELFTFDSDMEWDMNTPWYRPTRVNHLTSGSEFGWRNGTGKWPAYYPDSLPAVVNVGPGSPTGVTFGYGAKFPAKYQKALYLCDWSYGKLYVAHLTPDGSTYKGEVEEFITGTPLPLTDIEVNPKDGALYFTTGGRKTQSGLYRVTYVGDESTQPVKAENKEGAEVRALRHKLEAFHGKPDPKAVETAWPHLGHADRFIRFAARVAIEHQPAASWRDRALAEKGTEASLTALLALARVGDKSLQPKLLESLDRLAWEKLSERQKLELLRVYGLAFIRMGEPDAKTAKQVIAKFDPHYPAKARELNAELSKMLVYLEAPSAARETIALLKKAVTQEEQLDYALALRVLKTGWTRELREDYFKWFLTAANYKGGHSFAGFVRNIKNEAIANLPAEEKVALKEILEAKPEPATPGNVKPRPFVKKWTVAELTPLVEKGLTGRDFDHGREMFAAASCFACHRFGNEGGANGPDLTGVAGRFSPRDLLESLVEPNKTISDQYAAVTVETKKGQVITGRIVNLNNDNLMVNTNMFDPDAIARVKRGDIATLKPSPLSMMPEGLLDTLNQEEVLDLMAYLLSRGDRTGPMFK